MKRMSVWLRTATLFSVVGMFLMGASTAWSHNHKKDNDSTTHLLMKSFSRELSTMQRHISTLQALVKLQQKHHNTQVQNLQAQVRVLAARVKSLESGSAPTAKKGPAPSAPAAPKAPTAAAPSDTLPTGSAKDGAPSIGPANAKVTIVEYSDFQCPFCNRGATTVKQLLKEYKGKIRVVFKHFPLSFHKDAHLAAQASMAAHEQGKFWPYHDKLFANIRNLKKNDLIRYARDLKLDIGKFKAALDSGKYKKYVDKDLASASSAGANGTPTFIINGNKVVGAQPISAFKRVIDAVLAGKKVPSNAPPRRPTRPSGPVKVNVKGAPSFGPANAKVTVVAFSDFQCPFCSRGAKVIDQIKKEYKGKVKVVFKHLPLSFHKDAHLAAQASMAANEQGKFWAYHDKLFANMRNLKKADLIKYAGQLKLNVSKFKAALDSGKFKKYVDNDASEAGRVGADGTPTFFINGQRVVGAQPFGNFKRVIDAALSGKKVPAAAPPRPARPSGPVKVNVKGAPSFGPAKAKVTVVAFSDFQCPFCSRGARVIDQIKKEYKGKVKVVFKHLPLSFHKDAHLAAQASMAANEQGKFWAYHDKLFANMRNLKKADLIKYAGQLKLDVKKFTAALDSGKYKKYVDNDASEAGRVGADGTPTFFINGQRLVGAQPFNRFKSMIDAALKK